MGNRLLFNELVTTPLLRISAFRVALELWYHKIQYNDSTEADESDDLGNDNISYIFPFQRTNDDGTKAISNCFIFRELSNDVTTLIPCAEMRKAINALSLPRQILKMISDYAAAIGQEIIDWMLAHHRRAIFSVCKRASSSRETSGTVSVFQIMTNACFCQIVWRPDATIDCEKTARQLVKNGELDVFDKLDLMWMYFMEDEIRQNRDLWFQMQAKHNPVCLRNDPVESPTVLRWNSILDEESPNIDPFTNINYSLLRDHWQFRDNRDFLSSAFGRLSSHQRISYITRLITSGIPNFSALGDEHQISAFVLKFLISNCNETEQSELFVKTDFIATLMKSLASEEAGMEDTMKTWLHAKDLIDDNQCISILRNIGELRESDRDHIHELLVNLWRCSAPSMKKSVYEQFEYNDFLLEFCIRPDYFGLRNDGILIEVLSDAEPKFRKEIWRRYRDDIVEHSTPASLKAITGLCLSKDEIVAFKSAILSSRRFYEYSMDLILCGRCSDLEEYLEMFVGSEKQRLIQSKRLILRRIGEPGLVLMGVVVSQRSTAALKVFIDETFADDPDGLAKFKVEMISSYVTKCIFDSEKKMMKILTVSESLCDEPTLAKVKDRTVQVCNLMGRNWGSRCVSDEPSFSLLLMWCLERADKVAEFYVSLRKRRFE